MKATPAEFRSRPIRHGLRGGVFVVLVLVGILASLSRGPDVFLGGSIAYLDPDCYSRMTRVESILSGGPLSVRHHDFENAPEGIVTHATAPLDWLIALLAFSLSGFPAARDLAGAFVSPLLGALFFLALAGWGWRRRFGAAALALAATSPILAHGFSVGRPDHQSLALLLVGLAWICELGLWGLCTRDRRLWAVGSSLTWSLALWVSLFEPLILLLLTLSLRALVLRRRAVPRASEWLAPGIFSAVMILALLVDGWRFSYPSPEMRTLFAGWSTTIGELQGASAGTLFSWIGWLAPFLPLLLVGLAWKDASLKTTEGGSRRPGAMGNPCAAKPHRLHFSEMRLACSPRDPRALAGALLLTILLALTIWTSRWGGYLAMAASFSMPFALQSLAAFGASAKAGASPKEGGSRRPGAIGQPWAAKPRRLHFWEMRPAKASSSCRCIQARSGLVWLVFVASLWPMASAWDRLLFPAGEERARRLEARAENLLLMDTARHLAQMPDGIVLAPWWISPALAYWSGRPFVAGSSHQSLPGIADSARFFLATQSTEALEILRRRHVAAIVADDPQRVISNSAQILGRPPEPHTVASRLAGGTGTEIPGLNAVYRNAYFRVYEVLDAESDTTKSGSDTDKD